MPVVLLRAAQGRLADTRPALANTLPRLEPRRVRELATLARSAGTAVAWTGLTYGELVAVLRAAEEWPGPFEPAEYAARVARALAVQFPELAAKVLALRPDQARVLAQLVDAVYSLTAAAKTDRRLVTV
jgi:hypothetical protein